MLLVQKPLGWTYLFWAAGTWSGPQNNENFSPGRPICRRCVFLFDVFCSTDALLSPRFGPFADADFVLKSNRTWPIKPIWWITLQILPDGPPTKHDNNNNKKPKNRKKIDTEYTIDINMTKAAFFGGPRAHTKKNTPFVFETLQSTEVVEPPWGPLRCRFVYFGYGYICVLCKYIEIICEHTLWFALSPTLRRPARITRFFGFVANRPQHNNNNNQTGDTPLYFWTQNWCTAILLCVWAIRKKKTTKKYLTQHRRTNFF